MTAVPTYCPFERIPRRLYGGSPRSQIMSSEFETCFLDLKMQATKIIAKKTRKPVNTLDVSPKISSKFNAFYFPHLFFVAVATLTFWENFWPTKKIPLFFAFFIFGTCFSSQVFQDGKYLFKLAKCALALLSLEAATKGVPISGVHAASLGVQPEGGKMSL